MILKKNLPNILTLMNLSFGVLAILVASSTEKISLMSRGKDLNFIYFSCLLIVAAAIFDRFDGKLARMLDATSELGKQLDSLCDLVSFGVAPAVIAWKLHFSFAVFAFPGARLAGYTIALLFAMAGAFRLACFNLQEDGGCFYGIPITLAGSLLTLVNLIDTFLLIRGEFGRLQIGFTAVFMVLLSVLMVSRFRLQKI